MPRDLADLQAVATRQAVGPLGLGDPARQWDGPFERGALGDARWEFAPGAADQIWAAANTLGTWVRHLTESRGLKAPIARRGRFEHHRSLVIERNRAQWFRWRTFVPAPEQPIGTLVDWLLTNIESIRLDEAAKAIHDEIIGLHEENLRWSLGRSGADVFAGNCDATQVGFELVDGALQPVAATCGVALYGREDEADVRCSACGTRYPLQARLDEIHDRKINDQLARASTIASALSTFEAMLPQERLRKWIQRDSLRDPAQEGPACANCRHSTCVTIRRPPIQARGTDDDGFPLYRFGDVRRRLQQVKGPEAEKESA